MGNNNLSKAKKVKDDEFYTQLSDIENELKHYKDYFKDKIVFLNCDDPEESNFWKYFSLNFERLGLKKLVSTHFKDDEKTYKLEISQDINGDGKVNWEDVEKTMLKGNGDFRSPESIEILEECDIVVTNPPFSLFREYIEQLITNDKKFLVVGPFGAATYKGIFDEFIKENVWIGVSPRTMSFVTPGGEKKSVNACWFTNMKHAKRSEEFILFKKYYGNEKDYPRYDTCNNKGREYNTYDAININKLKDIPVDYEGNMGVPTTLLERLNPEQFELIGMINQPWVEGGVKFKRIIVRNKLIK